MGHMTAKVAVAKAIYAIDRPYDYRVPQELEGRLRPGMRVLVPFGAGNRGSDGIVLALSREGPEGGLKDVIAALDDQPVLDEKLLKLALWMRERYFCTVYDGVKAMLPAGLYYALRDCVALRSGVDRAAAFEAAGESKAAQKLAELLLAWGGRGDMEQIRTAFGAKDPDGAIRTLIDRGAAERITSAQRGIGDKKEKLAVLAMPAEEAMARVTPRRRTAPLRYSVTELLCQLGAAPAKELCYFTGASMPTVKSLEKSGILTLEEQEVFRRPAVAEVEPAGPIVLNEEQEAAFQGLDALCRTGQPAAALLYGVTGSGKTQVYLRLIQETLQRGKTALFLVPEIALTPQLLRIFAAHFGEQVAVLHSSLRAGERYDEWKRIRRGEAPVVIGTRSAVFAPLSNLGLVILDEEQEASYKSENNPRYHAREVAKYRCVQENALLLLGSATPSVETMYAAQSGSYRCFTLRQRYNQKALPQVHIVDMKEELRAGNGTSISRALRQELEENLVRGEQAILFLNRRGASRMVSCGECGHVPECPRCSVALTYHSANGRLMCHYCGHSERSSDTCPVCGGIMKHVGTGTQKVEEELHDLFPGTEVLRMDADTAEGRHEQLLDKFEREQIPILLGTQMVAKGLDFPQVTLVGVLAADLSLYVDNYRAAERTFSLLTQVVGRAGRGGSAGRAVIQTYTPENDVIQCAARQDYQGFYEREIRMRRLRRFPPFADLFTFTVSGTEEGAVLRAAAAVREELRRLCALPELAAGEPEVLGPAPAPVMKLNNRYRYRCLLVGKNDRPTREAVSWLLKAFANDRANRGMNLFVDCNSME